MVTDGRGNFMVDRNKFTFSHVGTWEGVDRGCFCWSLPVWNRKPKEGRRVSEKVAKDGNDCHFMMESRKYASFSLLIKFEQK